MESALEFAEFSGWADSVYAAPREWVWGPQGYGISNAYDARGKRTRSDLVFGVGWEVVTKIRLASNIGSEGKVFLWVDSPRDKENPALNALKRELVNDLMHSALHSVILAKGYQCDETSLRRKDPQMRRSMTTSVLKVWRSDTVSASPKAKMTIVHADLWPTVSQVLSPLRIRLNEHFHFT
jgi:hypothetical protein